MTYFFGRLLAFALKALGDGEISIREREGG